MGKGNKTKANISNEDKEIIAITKNLENIERLKQHKLNKPKAEKPINEHFPYTLFMPSLSLNLSEHKSISNLKRKNLSRSNDTLLIPPRKIKRYDEQQPKIIEIKTEKQTLTGEIKNPTENPTNTIGSSNRP